MLKIGVLGNSSIARRSVIPAIKECKDFVLAGVGSREGQSYESILDSDIDAVYVSLPVGLHYEWGKKVLKSGKHLLMEKTFTETYEQAKELFVMSKRLNLFCMEALMYEFHPLQKQIDSLLSVVGDIRCVEAHFGFPYIENKNDIRYQKNLGGGAILDTLVYPLSFVFRILGDKFLDHHSIIFRDEQSEVDDRGYTHFQYDDAVANISYGFGHSYRNEVTIWGEKAILKTNRVFTRPKNCDEPIQLISSTKDRNKTGKYERYEVENVDHFLGMINSFSDSISNNNDLNNDTLKRMLFVKGLM